MMDPKKALGWTADKVHDVLLSRGLEWAYMADVRSAMAELLATQPTEKGLVVSVCTPAEVYDALEAAMPQ